MDRSNYRLISAVIQKVPNKGKAPCCPQVLNLGCSVVNWAIRYIDIIEFEESFVIPLQEARATAMLQHGVNNMLAFTSPSRQQMFVLNING